MNLQDIYEAKSNRATLLAEAETLLKAKDMEGHAAKMEEIHMANTAIEAMEAQMLEEKRFAPPPETKPGVVPTGEPSAYEKAVKSFAQAARNGFRVDKAAGDSMQENVDADGGYTVPNDIVTRIISLRESKESLLDLVRIEKVKTSHGRRTLKKRSQHTGFSTVAEAAKYGKMTTPQFTTLEYTIEKRGGFLPVTEELLADSDNNIAAVAEEWLADESRATANNEIITAIRENTSTDLKDLDGILAAWIGLGSTFRATSKLVTNDDGLLWLGTLKDANGRYLLTPNPADSKELRLCVGPHVLPVKTYDNDTLTSEGTKIPMILGDLNEGVVYWDRRQFSVKVSDTAVAGDFNAFEMGMMLWRGSLRDDCTLRDKEAFVNGYIDTAAE